MRQGKRRRLEGSKGAASPSPAASLYRDPGASAPPLGPAVLGVLAPKHAVGLGFKGCGPFSLSRIGYVGWCGWPMLAAAPSPGPCGPHMHVGSTSRLL